MTDVRNDQIDALLADLWQRHLPTLRERLNILDAAAAGASSGAITEACREEALSVAHKLSGNLGMFGCHKAGHVASQIENILKSATPQELVRLYTLTQELRTILAPRL